MLVLALTATRFPSSSQSHDATPEDCVWTMVRAEQEGQRDVYLACFVDPLGEGPAQQAITRPDVGQHHRNRNGELQGISIVRRRNADGNRAELTLERVYPRYNTRQQIRLRRIGRSWRIAHLGAPEHYVPEIAYGTPVESVSTAVARSSDSKQ